MGANENSPLAEERLVPALTGRGTGFLRDDGVFSRVSLSVRAAAGVPSGAPVAGESWIAFDSTGTTGGVYYWSGSAWVRMTTNP